jgi:hypothetical protein
LGTFRNLIQHTASPGPAQLLNPSFDTIFNTISTLTSFMQVARYFRLKKAHKLSISTK